MPVSILPYALPSTLPPSGPSTNTSYTVTINGQVVTIVAGTLDIEDAIGQRSTCTFDVRDDAGGATYIQGMPATVTAADGSVPFTGFVYTSTQVKRDSYGVGLVHSIQCMDGHYLADKRIAATSYTNQTADFIVKDLITNYLVSEGVAAGAIQAGPSITSAIFNYVPVSQCIDKLAELAGFWWYIDHSNVLHFAAPSALTAPFVADGTHMEESSVQVVRGNGSYRNSQFMLGGTDVTTSQTETSPGNGQTRAFTLAFPVSQVPTVQTNIASAGYTTKTVGVKGVDTGKDFYWAKSDPVISQDSSGTLLTSSDLIKVTYIGQYNFVALARDSAQVASQAATEGGTTTGYVETAAVDNSLTSSTAAFQSASAKLTRFATTSNTVVFDTLSSGLAPGQQLTVNLPDHNLPNATTLIESVSTRDNGAMQQLSYTITAIQGPTNTNWVQFFQSLSGTAAQSNGQISLGQGTVLVVLESVSESWTWTESGTTPTVYSCPIPGPSLNPGPTLYPC